MKSLNSNILAFALLATLVPSIGLGIVSFAGYQDVISRNVEYELRSLSKDASTELTSWLRERGYDLRTLSAAYTLVDGLGVDSSRPGAVRIGAPELALYLATVQRKLEPLLELTLRDADGRVIASSAATPAAAPLPATWPAASLANGVVVEPPHWDEAHAAPSVTVAVPVLSPRNELLGALLAVLDLRHAEPRLRSVVTGSPAEVVVMATDGTPLISTKGPVSVLSRVDPEVLLRLRGQSGEPIAYTDFRGQASLAFATTPAALPLVVVAQRERAEVFAAWVDLLEKYVAIVIGLTVLVGLVGYWMGRSIVAPLRALTTAAGRVAQGDLAVTLHDETKDEIGRLTRAFATMTERLRTSQAELTAANEALRRQNVALETLATTDSLTGLFNRKKLDAILVEGFARFRRDRIPFALIMLAIDNLDRINDDYGLPAGDEVLVRVAAMVKQALPEDGQVARFGGERFVAMLGDVPFDDAMDVAARIRALIDAPEFSAANAAVVTTVSIGVAQSREHDEDADSILFRADHALHEARRAGGNRVQSAM
ncbi:MAG: diguanylate cyclase [Burkholderiales bacterium]|nr:diguanylate cyclase [Burkholderiales bacterium]